MKYPDLEDEDFYEKINKIYREYKIPDKKKSLKEICYPKKYELQKSQLFLSKFINPDTEYKSILVYHRIGSGKTCTAIRVGEEWKNLRKIIVVVPASLKGNFRNELRSPCAGNNYLTHEEREELKKHHPSSKEYKKIIEISDKRIDKHYEIYSYNKFIQYAQENKISLKNKVLIIDEIQNMVSEEGTYYHELYKLIHSAPKDLRIILLSATPMFDKPDEIALTLNLLRLPIPMPTGCDFYNTFIKSKHHDKHDDNDFEVRNIDLFKKLTRGYVSYFRGAPPHVFPEMNIKYVKCEMSDFQYTAYKAILRNEEKIDLNLKKRAAKSLSVRDLPNSFFIGTRYVSNIVYPNRKIGEEGFKSLTAKQVTENLDLFSVKFSKIMSKISRSRGKVFVYSAFKEHGGIKAFVRVLESFGYKNYEKHSEGKKRFAIWSGDEDIRYREEVKNVYNMKDNLDGSRLKILLLTSAAKEGLSLFGVRQAHILEPYWNISRLLQIIGRGSRFCSHKELPPKERDIKVYIYMATHPEEEQTIDEYIRELSFKKNKVIHSFEKAIKEVAVDCTLFKNANVFKGEEDIICEK